MEVGGDWVAALVPSWQVLDNGGAAWGPGRASWRYQPAALRWKARKPSGEVSGSGFPHLCRWPGGRPHNLHHLPHGVRGDIAAARPADAPAAVPGHRGGCPGPGRRPHHPTLPLHPHVALRCLCSSMLDRTCCLGAAMTPGRRGRVPQGPHQGHILAEPVLPNPKYTGFFHPVGV